MQDIFQPEWKSLKGEEEKWETIQKMDRRF